MAGYSGTPLAAKLGIKSSSSLLLIDAPSTLELDLPEDVTVDADLREGADVIVAFFTRLDHLERAIDELGSAVHPSGALWVAWPKKASRIETDLSDNHVRACALQRGLVDNKVCAINETWSALRVVWRKELRGDPTRASPTPK